MLNFKKFRNSVAYALSAAFLVSGLGVAPVKADAAETTEKESFKQVYEFEDANRFSSDWGNKVRNDLFQGYSGNGFVYLVKGWAEVHFTVPSDGKYKITVVSNSDQWKKNWLYLDQNGAGEIDTWENRWNETTNEYDLTAGEHKFGVSTDWGYVALDKVIVEKVDETPVTPDNPPVGPTDPDNPPVGPTDPDNPPVGPTDPSDLEATQLAQIAKLKGEQLSSPVQTKGSLKVQGSKLYDGNGNEFVMRGINIAHGWFPEQTEKGINAVERLGANSVRVVLCDGQGLREGYKDWRKTPRSEVEAIIKQCREKNLICELEVHDHTGSDDPAELQSAVNYWKDIADLVNANKDYVIVNIANEWMGTWNVNTWKNSYKDAIKQLRNAGIGNVIMVDALGWGQDIDDAASAAKEVLSADSTGNTMFSGHIYSVAGPNESAVKTRIDNMINSGTCFVIGEFGNYQGGGNVDEKTIMTYAKEKNMGTMAWSWIGNGGKDMPLDLTNDDDANKLTKWGRYVFFAKDIGIHYISKKAYTGYKPTGDVTPLDPDDSADGTGPDKMGTVTGGTTVVDPPEDGKVDINPEYFKKYTKWQVVKNGDDKKPCKSTQIKQLADGGYRVSYDLAEEDYPTIMTFTKGLNLSSSKKMSVIVRNNSADAIQLQPIFKVGKDYLWDEYDQYKEIPAQTTVQLDFDLARCTDIKNVNAVLFRIQGAGAKTAGTIDFLSAAPDLDKSANAGSIAELNRPKSASFFNWAYPDNSWAPYITKTTVGDGKVTLDYKNASSKNASGLQTETQPGLGKGKDFSAYKTLTCTLTNKGTEDVCATLLFRTSGGWTWQENAGKDGNEVIPAGKSVKVTYVLNGSKWKSKESGWKYTGKLQDADDVRAFGFKVWSNKPQGGSGTLEVSDLEFHF